MFNCSARESYKRHTETNDGSDVICVVLSSRLEILAVTGMPKVYFVGNNVSAVIPVKCIATSGCIVIE